MRFARRMASVKPSATLAVTNRAKVLKAQGVDIVSFGAGEPDFDTPPFVVDAMAEAARSGKTRYAAVTGVPELRSTVARHFTELYGTKFDRENIMVSCGGKHALYNLFQVLVDPGDEVIIPAPYWVSYPAQVELAEGVPVIVQTNADRGFELDVKAIEASISDRSVGIVLNSPSNPAGAVASAETLGAIADLAAKHDLWIVSDDIYSHLRYDDGPFASVLRARPEMKDRIVIVHGASKTYAMTGWRLGWVGARRDLIKQMATLQGQVTSGANTFAQFGAIAALNSDHSFLRGWLHAYRTRRDCIVALLNAIEGVNCATPGGAFYVFPDFRGVIGRRYEGTAIKNCLHFAEMLLEHAHVALVPGAPFGAPGFMRLSYACSMEDIEKGLTRIAEFVAKLD